MRSEIKTCQTDLQKETNVQQQALCRPLQCLLLNVSLMCVCVHERGWWMRGGTRLNQATDAAEQTGICPVHLPQRLQQRGAVTRPPVNTHTNTQCRGVLIHTCTEK